MIPGQSAGTDSRHLLMDRYKDLEMETGNDRLGYWSNALWIGPGRVRTQFEQACAPP